MSNHQLLELDAEHPRFPDIFERAPIVTSLNSRWSKISLEIFSLSQGETPEYSVDHYVIGINAGQRVEVDQSIDGKVQRATFFQGTAVLCPIHSRHFFCWDSSIQIMSLSLATALINQNSVEILGSKNAELIPNFGIQDGLIYQIALALQAELKSQNSSTRLYAETMANALAVHLLRNYSTQGNQIVSYNGGLPQHKLRLVTDYINDYVERELSLGELAAIAQLSQHHFCRAFKQATGLSPHQYLIQQRVERAKQLLRSGKMRISEVAIACGFTHQSHLHRHFKRLTGVTPKAWLNL